MTQIQKLGPSIFASLPKFRHPWHTIASILICFVLVFESEYRIVYCACSDHPQPSRRPLPCWKLTATSKRYFSWEMGRQWKNYRALLLKFHYVRFDLSILLLLFFFYEKKKNNLRHNEGSPGIFECLKCAGVKLLAQRLTSQISYPFPPKIMFKTKSKWLGKIT